MKEYIVLSRTNGTTKTGASFATLKVSDGTDTLNVAVWDLGPKQEPVVGRIVSFYNLRDNQGKHSCNAGEIKNGPMPDPSHPLYNLLPRPISSELWHQTLDRLIGLCTDATLIDIIREFGEKLYRPYSEYPAATSVHHAYPGGLLNHTHQMLAMLLGIYPSLPYPVNPERCVLAILFHDYGKVYEYNREGETREDMYLLGHIYIGAHKLHTELERRGVDEAEIKRIVHCVLAHHGCLEYGSPVVPCTPEAEIISHLDDISAKTDNMDGTGHMEKSFALGTHVVK